MPAELTYKPFGSIIVKYENQILHGNKQINQGTEVKNMLNISSETTIFNYLFYILASSTVI